MRPDEAGAPTGNEAVGADDVGVSIVRAGKTRGVFNTADQLGGNQPLALRLFAGCGDAAA